MEELGRHRGREGWKECLLCDAECESVSHVLWDCPAYVSIRSAFMFRGGSRIDGRGVLVRLASHGLRAQARQLGGSGGMPPQENLGFQEF